MINLKITDDIVTRKFDNDFLTPKNELYPPLWDGNKLNFNIAKRILKISEDIINSMDIKAEIQDIIITGSIASYNWHRLSDIDLHIVFNFEDIDKNFSLVKRALDQSRINWNKTHDIRISDKEVELYFQDVEEPHHSIGVFSLKNNKWLKVPKKQNTTLDLKSIEKKANGIATSVEHVADLVSSKQFEEAYNFSSKLKRKISRMRKSGLEKEGIYSVENLAFKMLRNEGYLEKLSFLKTFSYDQKMSIKVVSEVNNFFDERSQDDYLKYSEHEMSKINNLLDLSKPAPWDV